MRTCAVFLAGVILILGIILNQGLMKKKGGKEEVIKKTGNMKVLIRPDGLIKAVIGHVSTIQELNVCGDILYDLFCRDNQCRGRMLIDIKEAVPEMGSDFMNQKEIIARGLLKKINKVAIFGFNPKAKASLFNIVVNCHGENRVGFFDDEEEAAAWLKRENNHFCPIDKKRR